MDACRGDRLGVTEKRQIPIPKTSTINVLNTEYVSGGQDHNEVTFCATTKQYVASMDHDGSYLIQSVIKELRKSIEHPVLFHNLQLNVKRAVKDVSKGTQAPVLDNYGHIENYSFRANVCLCV